MRSALFQPEQATGVRIQGVFELGHVGCGALVPPTEVGAVDELFGAELVDRERELPRTADVAVEPEALEGRVEGARLTDPLGHGPPALRELAQLCEMHGRRASTV